MPTNPIPTSPNTPTMPGTPATTGTSPSAGILGKDDFLKLLIGQMKNQDPLNPTDSTQYIGQITQFSILEQISNSAKTSAATAANAYDAQAVALIGKTVTYTKPDLSTVTGVVQKVAFTKDGPTLTIDGISGIAPLVITGVQ